MQSQRIFSSYFSHRWCPPCKSFTPTLSSFYTAHCKPSNVEIIYISSDTDIPSFNEYYGTMPWCSLPPANSAQIKQKLADGLKISGLPTLVVLDSKGHFVCDTARNDVMAASGDEEKSKELIQKWKAIEAVPIEEARLSGTGPAGMIKKLFMMLMKNPMYMVGMIFMMKKLFRKIQSLRDGDGDGEEEEL